MDIAGRRRGRGLCGVAEERKSDWWSKHGCGRCCGREIEAVELGYCSRSRGRGRVTAAADCRAVEVCVSQEVTSATIFVRRRFQTPNAA